MVLPNTLLLAACASPLAEDGGINTRTEPARWATDVRPLALSPDVSCFHVGQRKSADPSPCYSKRNTAGYVEAPLVSAIIQSFKDSPRQATQLLTRLRAITASKEIIVNDDTHGKQQFWVQMLSNNNEFYIASPNLHEVRAYNRLIQYARGELLMFVQGDTCLPYTPMWVDDAVDLFRVLPYLGMLSGRAGFDAVLNWQMEKPYRDVRTWGSEPYKAIDRMVPRPNKTTGEGGIAFRFVPGVDNGPLFYRRQALLGISGFDESYSCAPGHLSGHYDFEASLRFWLKGWQVGVFYGGSANGVGGRKTSRNKIAKSERHSNEIWNGKRVARLWTVHNTTIYSRIADSTRLYTSLIPQDQRMIVRQQTEARIGKASKRCEPSKSAGP